MKRKTMPGIFIWLLISLSFIQCSSKKKMINNDVVKEFSLDKFLGTWYEIARYPHRFEKDLVGVTANYSLREDGKIKVINRGFKNTLDGPAKKIVGKAKIPDPENPAKLKVSFFWIFYSDYLVMELDQENYQWAVIGSSSPNYLWILGRESKMDEKLLKTLIKKIEDRGYDTSNLELVEQIAE